MNRLSILLCALLGGCVGVASPDAGDVEPAPDDAGRVDAGTNREDAGAPDAGTPDAGTPPLDGGAGPCPATAIFCDDFETGLDAAKWLTNGDATTFTIDTTTPAAHGTRSLHMAYGQPYGHTGYQTVQIKPRLAAPDDRVYVRAFMRFADLKLPGAHPFFIDVSDGTGTELGFGSIINDFAFMAYAPNGLDDARIWYEGGGGWHPGVENGDATPNTENTVTAQTWVCVELMYFGDHQGAGDTQHPGEQVTVWLDGVEIPQLAASDAIWQQALGRAPPEHWSPVYDGARWKFGVSSFGPDNVALDIWFDAIAVSHTRIGCDR